MADALRVIVEIGEKRKVVACATDWPGLERWGKTEDDALATLTSYIPRYAGVAKRAGMASEFERSRTIEVIERVPGDRSTGFWGLPHVPAQIEHEPLSPADLERRLEVLGGCWAYFDEVAASVSADLRLGPRGSGRSRDQIIRHLYFNEPDTFFWKVGVRAAPESALDPKVRATLREQFLDAVRAYNAEGKLAKVWPVQFLVRRVAQHVMDHAWEMEDRDLTT